MCLFTFPSSQRGGKTSRCFSLLHLYFSRLCLYRQMSRRYSNSISFFYFFFKSTRQASNVLAILTAYPPPPPIYLFLKMLFINEIRSSAFHKSNGETWLNEIMSPNVWRRIITSGDTQQSQQRSSNHGCVVTVSFRRRLWNVTLEGRTGNKKQKNKSNRKKKKRQMKIQKTKRLRLRIDWACIYMTRQWCV